MIKTPSEAKNQPALYSDLLLNYSMSNVVPFWSLFLSSGRFKNQTKIFEEPPGSKETEHML
jgi:hypothetical protein